MRKIISRSPARISIVLFTVVYLVCLGGAAGALSRAGAQSTTHIKPSLIVPSRRYAPTQIIVKYRPGLSTNKKNDLKAAAGVERLLDKVGPEGKQDTYLYKLKPGRTVAESVAKLKADPNVSIAEPNQAYSVALMPNDTYFGNQWGLHNTGQVIGGAAGTADADVDAPEAWAMLTGKTATATIAVIDTGIDPTHPDLAARLWSNASETLGNNIDDDGNGYIDDVFGHNWADISQYANEGTVYLGQAAPDPHISELAQSFVGNGGNISSVWFEAIKSGAPASGVRVSIRSNLGGSDLASVSLPASAFTSSWTTGWVNASFASPVKVDEGVIYYVVVHTDVNDSVNSYLVSYTDYATNGGKNAFPDGSFWINEAGWVQQSQNDFSFALTFDGLGGRGGAPKDGNGHGTHVGGIAAGATDNGVGVAGLGGYPPGAARIMPLRALDTEGWGDTAAIVDAIYYAADNGADVINMSLGGAGFSASFQAAIDYADSKGVVVTAAAGNNGNTTLSYPAGYNHVIGVAATTNKDLRASYSNYNSSVDVAAPGSNIYSSTPTYPFYDSINFGGVEDYDYLSGTSMATPFVAGLAALLRSAAPALSPAQIEQIIKDGAADLGVAGRDDLYGYGRINAADSLAKLTPTTTLNSSPTVPNGDSGWYVTAPSLTLEAGPLVATPYYAWDSTASPATYTVPFQPPEGTATLYYYSVSGAGIVEAPKSRAFRLDTVKPVGPTLSSATPTGTPSATQAVTVALSGASDTGSGLAGFSGLWDRLPATAPTTATVNMLSSAGSTSSVLADGSWYFHIRTKDNAGNWRSPAHIGPFVIDARPPTGAVVVNGDDTYTVSTNISLSLSATDATGSGVTQMRVAETTAGLAGAAYGSYSATTSFPLSIGDGIKTVYAQFKDAVGNESALTSDFIFLDTSAPSGSVFVNNNETYTIDNNVALTLSATDGIGSGIDKIRFAEDTAALAGRIYESFQVTTAFPLSAGDGGKTVYVQVKDAAGNESVPASDAIIVDTSVPVDPTLVSPSHIIGKPSSIRVVAIDLSDATDLLSGLAGFSGLWDKSASTLPSTSAIDFSSTTTRTVSAPLPDGSWYFHLRTKDVAGNWTSTAHIGPFIIDTTGPSVTVDSPTLSTNESKSKVFKVSWSGVDYGGGVDAYDVRYKVGPTGGWVDWKVGVQEGSADFTGRPGKTYYFSTRATDSVGNKSGWSAESKTIVPYDQNSMVKKRVGFRSTAFSAGSKNYLGTVRFSKTQGDLVVYGFTGNYFAFITSSGRGHGRADIYIDGKFVKRIDTGAKTTKHRRVAFERTWRNGGSHKVRIVNRATPRRPRLDLDAIAIGK